MPPFQPKKIRNLGVYGLIREAEVDSQLIPDNAVTEAINVHFDRKGAVQTRLGIAGLGSTVSAGNSCLGLYNVQSATAIAAFISGGSLTVFSYNGSAWNSSLTGTGGSANARFADFANRTIFISGLERSIRCWNGSADGTSYWDNSGNPINPQQLWYVNGNTNSGYIRPKFVEVYKSRLYLAGDSVNPDRLYFSNIIDTSGNLAWTPSTDFVDINPNDGENITGLKRFALELLVFKNNYIYRFRTSGVDPDPLIKIGTKSNESIIEGKRGVYFHHDTGFYRYTGGYPEEISRPISDFITNITYANYSNIAGWKDSDHIYWYVGNVIVNEPYAENVTWTSVVLRYTESSDVWTIYSYPTNLTRGITFNSGSALSQLVGLSTGVVATFNSGNTDLTEPIKFRVSTKWYEWEEIAERKIIKQIVSICEKAQGAMLMYQTDDNVQWENLGNVKDLITYFYPLNIRFNRIRFKITGVTSSEQSVFLGIEITEGINEGIIVR